MSDNFILTVNNFGPIDSAKIDLGKINVVGGKNSTGKSTASKLLYCFLKANASDRQEIAFKSIISDLKGIARDSKRALGSENLPDSFKNTMSLNEADFDSVINDFYELKDIVDKKINGNSFDYFLKNFGELDDRERYEIINEINEFISERGRFYVLYDEDNNIIDIEDLDDENKYENFQLELLNSKKEKLHILMDSIDNMESVIKEIKNNSQVLSYSIMKQLLEEEFSVEFGITLATFRLLKEYESLVDAYGERDALKLYENELRKDVPYEYRYTEFDTFVSLTSKESFCKVNLDKKLFESSEGIRINDVFYIDSFSLFDSILFEGFSRTVHLKQLTDIFRNTKQPKRLFDDIINKNIIQIEEEINQIIQGKFEYSVDGMTFNSSNHSHVMKNTASGLKQFGIIQILLQSRKLTPNTYLIMDEPEVNLHPEWQIKFANILVLLAKSLDMHIYINSHSPLFINAIEAYTEYYDMQDDTNYYLTRSVDLGKNIFEKIDAEDLYEIYDELGQPYHKLNILNLKNRY